MSGVEIMSIDWNFPGNNFGTLSGIGEAGIETFKGSPCRSLAREICQNSLDARLDPGQAGQGRIFFVIHFARRYKAVRFSQGRF